MNLDAAQQQQVIAWLSEGATLAQVQTRIETDFGLRLTYRDVKFLVSDLRILPKDAELPAPAAVPGAVARPSDAPRASGAEEGMNPQAPPRPQDRVRMAVDQLARPGTVVSGTVTFSDGHSAVWSIDQMGRLGIAPKEKGHRPSADDLQHFQMLLEEELARQGL